MTMRHVLTALTALVLTAGSAGAAVQIGQPAPDFAGLDSGGQTQRLSDYRGKTVVLEWTNHDCPYVRKHYEVGNMQRQQRAAAEQGVVWLSVISSAPGKQGHVSAPQANQLTASRNASPSAVVLDEQGEIGRAYGALTTPHMFIIDGEGILRYMGGIDNLPTTDPADVPKATQHLEIALGEVLSGQAVSTPVTRPYGCSVKY